MALETDGVEGYFSIEHEYELVTICTRKVSLVNSAIQIRYTSATKNDEFGTSSLLALPWVDTPYLHRCLSSMTKPLFQQHSLHVGRPMSTYCPIFLEPAFLLHNNLLPYFCSLNQHIHHTFE